MKTYSTIDDFIREAFPMECEKIRRQQPSDIETAIKDIDDSFRERLEEIISGNKTNLKEKER
ncbi:hypothetical protein FACS1894137_15220 [Spirochaetia bacterium]|nr:hypothetical protein FACS1894137_15220 [Spirochaetia bacterium]